MKAFVKKMLCLFAISGISYAGIAQKEWIGQLSLESIDCENQSACYVLSIKGNSEDAWALGDQNYRFFYDAANISITDVNSLLPDNFYSSARIDDVLEITGQNQEDFSPLDNIDSNLGFLDFSITAYLKQAPHSAVQIKKQAFIPIAKICVEISAELLEDVEDATAMNILFSRPETAGQITRQYTVISEIDRPGGTQGTKVIDFIDVTDENGVDARLGKFCQSLEKGNDVLANDAKFTLFPNPAVAGEVIVYQSAEAKNDLHDIIIQDVTGKVIALYKQLASDNQEIKLPNLSAGTYFMKIFTKNDHAVKKLVVVGL